MNIHNGRLAEWGLTKLSARRTRGGLDSDL